MLTRGAQYAGYTVMGQRVNTRNDQLEEVLRPRIPPPSHPSPASPLTYIPASEEHEEHTPSPNRAFRATKSPRKRRELTPSPEKASPAASPAKLVWELSPTKKEQTPSLSPFRSASQKSRQQTPAPVKRNSPSPDKLPPTLRTGSSTPSRSRITPLSPGQTQITVQVNPLVEISGIVGKFDHISPVFIVITYSFVVVVVCISCAQVWCGPLSSAIGSFQQLAHPGLSCSYYEARRVYGR